LDKSPPWGCIYAGGTAGERNETVCHFGITSEARHSACQFVIASEARHSACQFVIASEAWQSACQLVILSAAKDLILRKQADCRAPSRHLKAKVIPVAGARSDGLAAACVRWAPLASATRLSVISSLRAQRGNLPFSLPLWGRCP